MDEDRYERDWLAAVFRGLRLGWLLLLLLGKMVFIVARFVVTTVMDGYKEHRSSGPLGAETDEDGKESYQDYECKPGLRPKGQSWYFGK